jgi:hypothetical protein
MAMISPFSLRTDWMLMYLAKPSDLASCLDCSEIRRRRAADVEGTHGELRAGFADGLRRDDADRFAALDQTAGGQVAAVAGDANAALRFAGQHGADLDALDAGRLNRRGEFFGDLLIDATMTLPS